LVTGEGLLPQRRREDKGKTRAIGDFLCVSVSLW
jgi:hypothetical protein